MIFTVFMIAVCIILRPTEISNRLSQMQEILDETLTEMPTQEDHDMFDGASLGCDNMDNIQN
jgi:hypothetical protein